MSSAREIDAAADDDDRLLSRVRAGDDQALGELFDRFGAQVYRAAFAVCRERERAEEAVQETFLAVWREPSSRRPERGAVGPWLLTIVCHRAAGVLRRDEAAGSRAPAEAGRLHGLLARLPDAQREVISLAYFGQLSPAEIARQLGLRPVTVKGRLRLGMRKLRRELERSA